MKLFLDEQPSPGSSRSPTTQSLSGTAVAVGVGGGIGVLVAVGNGVGNLGTAVGRVTPEGEAISVAPISGVAVESA